MYDNSLFFYPPAEGIFLYFKLWSLDMEIYFTKTLIYQMNGRGKESIPHWSNFRGAIDSPFYKNRDKYG